MIRIGSRYAIKADTDCWQFGTVGVRTNKKTGHHEEYIVSPVYPATLDLALKRYAEREVRDADPQSWAEVLEALRTVREEIATVSAALGAA